MGGLMGQALNVVRACTPIKHQLHSLGLLLDPARMQPPWTESVATPLGKQEDELVLCQTGSEDSLEPSAS